MGLGRVSLVTIGEDAAVSDQPCGGFPCLGNTGSRPDPHCPHRRRAENRPSGSRFGAGNGCSIRRRKNMTQSRFIVDADWLQARLGDPTLRRRCLLVSAGARSAIPRLNTAPRCIPGAVFYDQDVIADLTGDCPTIPQQHAFPPPWSSLRSKAIPSSFTTVRASSARRASGGCCGHLARRTSSC